MCACGTSVFLILRVDDGGVAGVAIFYRDRNTPPDLTTDGPVAKVLHPTHE